MAQIIKLRRGTLAELNGVTLNNGEIGKSFKYRKNNNR
jgi:hypothetical protein